MGTDRRNKVGIGNVGLHGMLYEGERTGNVVSPLPRYQVLRLCRRPLEYCVAMCIFLF